MALSVVSRLSALCLYRIDALRRFSSGPVIPGRQLVRRIPRIVSSSTVLNGRQKPSFLVFSRGVGGRRSAAGLPVLVV